MVTTLSTSSWLSADPESDTTPAELASTLMPAMLGTCSAAISDLIFETIGESGLAIVCKLFWLGSFAAKIAAGNKAALDAKQKIASIGFMVVSSRIDSG